MRNVHNQHGHYGGQISLVFTISCRVAVYGVDHGRGIPTTFTGRVNRRSSHKFQMKFLFFPQKSVNLVTIFGNSDSHWTRSRAHII